MAEKKPRKQEVEEEAPENAERWLLSYADMITLLVAFFVMMYAMSVVNIKKFNDVAISIRSGFGGSSTGDKGRFVAGRNWSIIGSKTQPMAVGSGTEGGREQSARRTVSMAPKDETFLEHVRSQLAYMKMDMTIQPILDVEPSEGNRYSLILSDQIAFQPGSAEITPENLKLVTSIGGFLTNMPVKVVVEGFSGHFQDSPKFGDSWQLSLERARQVADVLVKKCDINPRRITLMGYGEWKTVTRARKLAMTAGGEWKPAEEVAPDIIRSNDRVTISVLFR